MKVYDNIKKRLGKRKLTVSELLSEDDVTNIIDKLYDNSDDIAELVVIVITKSGRRICYTTLRANATLGVLERAKFGLLKGVSRR